MTKIIRCIVEVDSDFNESERDLRKALLRLLKATIGTEADYRVKGFNAVMARERKKGKRERRRFEAGR